MARADDPIFCKQCHGHIKCAGQLLQNGMQGQGSLQAGFEFANLQLLAQSQRRLILEKYAAEMKRMSRWLMHQEHTDQKMDLYKAAIQFGLQCAGVKREQCIEMRYDQWLPIERQIKTLGGE